MPRVTKTLILILLITLAAGLNAGSANPPAWQAYAYHAGTYQQTGKRTNGQIDKFADSPICPFDNSPPSWQILAALQTDLTRDGVPECALLVWRPWQDWPIMQWSDRPSPIAANQDAHGDSAHVILMEIASGEWRVANGEYREIWAGSALAVPILQMAVGDVDGDGWEELVALEGDYATGREGPARHVAVWRWNGFGFTLVWRSPAGRLGALALADLDGDKVLEILVR